MSKTLLLCALASVLLMGLAAGAYADATVYQQAWSASDWSVDPHTNIPVLTLSNITWQGATDGAAILRLTGPLPCGNDPDVHEAVTNTTPVPWTDWHVTIQNGTIESAFVKKVSGASWLVTITEDGSGFDAMTALDSGKIDVGEQLDVWFRYTINGTGPVVIDEYPTTGYIPEPSSLIAFASALGALGIGCIRKKLAA